MEKYRVLFVCVRNSARSRMAEAWLNRLHGDLFEAESAGMEPGVLHPLTVEVMKEAGIDISHRTTRSVLDAIRQGKLYSYVITVCDEASAERCPIYPGVTTRLHWSFPDPVTATGTRDERLETFRKVRDSIRLTIDAWAQEIIASQRKP